MHLRLPLTVLILIAGVAIGCAGSVTHPASPTPDPSGDFFKFVEAGPNTILLGAWEVFIDIEAGEVRAVELRTASMHYNVSPMLKPPKCYGCFLAKNLSYDPITQVVTVDVGFRNPSNLTGYDVRGIVTSFGNMVFLNPDGYTELFSPTPGKINPFVAFKTGVGQREIPPLTSQYETMQIYDPNFPSFAPFTYVVEASWPDNCKEPYEVLFANITGDLFDDGSNAPILQLYARDWQDNVIAVNVDLTPIGGTTISLTPNMVLPDVWEGPISCAPGTPTGEYDLLAWATSDNPVDQISVIYNYITVKVKIPPSPEAEVFGPPERIAITPGESFIWPRHAIAVTSDGVSHVVWVDNSPDPESNVFHVYYSNSLGGTWSPPEQIDGEDGMAVYATIAADPDDIIHIVWEDERDHVLGSDLYYATSLDNFVSETVLAHGENGLRTVHPKIVSANDGTLHVAWHSLELIDVDKYEYDVWYMDRPGGSAIWDGAVSVVAEEDVRESFPAIAPAPLGSVYMAFQSDQSGSNGIYFTKNVGGTFTQPLLITLGDSYQPALDVAPDGKLVLAYFDHVDGTFSDISMRTSSDAGDTWSVPQLVSDSNDAYQYAPDVECTSDGDYHVAWHEEDESGRPARVLYREYVSTLGWQDIVEIVGPGNMGAFPSMDGDSDGRIHIIYELLTPVEPPGKDNYEIWYRDSVP